MAKVFKIFPAVLVLMMTTLSSLATASDKASAPTTEQARSVVEKYYQLNGQHKYAEMDAIFSSDALIEVVWKYGYGQPDYNFKFRVNELDKFSDPKQWGGKSMGSYGQNMFGSYKEFRRTHTLKETEKDGATVSVNGVQTIEYELSNYKGEVKASDTFKIQMKNNKPVITQMISTWEFK